MTAPRPPFRRAFPFWALLLWLAVGLSVWPAQALTAPAPSSPALVDDGGLFGQALPRDAGGQWQRRDSGDDPGWEPQPTQGGGRAGAGAALSPLPQPRPTGAPSLTGYRPEPARFGRFTTV